MPIKFSEEFNISNELIETYGVFDVIMDVDTHVFVDPALLELCDEPEFSNAEEKIKKYFSDIIKLLSHSKNTDDMYWKAANKKLKFKELSGTCFGYSKKSTDGNAIGGVLREKILSTTKELIDEGETDPTLFELLGVFQENIGCDRISDLITFILAENILEYTERIAHTFNINNLTVQFGKKTYQVCENNYNGKPLLLLPKTILSPLPVMTDFDDIDTISAENERVREAINRYIDFDNRKKLSKSDILFLMRNNPEFRQTIISSYKNFPKTPYDFDADPAGEYAWYAAAKEYTSQYPLNFSEITISTIDDVEKIARLICEQFKSLVENNGLSALLFDSNGKPKKESASQLLFFGVADSYCIANDIDLTREGNNGRGPVDFKLSKGASQKILVETKLTSNPQLNHGIEKQVPIYMKQENTQKAIYLIIDTGHDKALENFIKYYNALDVKTKAKIKYMVVDATSKPSASKA